MKFFIEFIAVVLIFYAVTGIVHLLEKRGYLKQGALARGLGTDPNTKKTNLKKAILISSSIATIVVVLILVFWGKG